MVGGHYFGSFSKYKINENERHVMCKNAFSLSNLAFFIFCVSNSLDPDQTPSKSASDEDQSCLQRLKLLEAQKVQIMKTAGKERDNVCTACLGNWNFNFKITNLMFM